MKKHPLIKATEDFLKALKDCDKDEYINLNLGYHDEKMLSTWKTLNKEVKKSRLGDLMKFIKMEKTSI